MTYLNFEWHDSRRGGEYRAHVGGLTVKAIQDCDSRNPWKDMYGLAPLMSYSERTLTSYGDWPDVIAAMSDSFIARHWRELCEIAGMATEEAERHKRDGTYFRIADARRDLLDDWIACLDPGKYGYSGTRYFEAMESLYGLLRWPCLRTTSRGYSQGDYAELFLAWNPQFAASIGRAMPRSAKQAAAIVAELESAAKLWGAWAWGDVYGYVIESESGDVLDSVWGYYGSDFAESGLAEDAESRLADIREERRERRAARLKALIRARVPLGARAAIMEGFPL